MIGDELNPYLGRAFIGNGIGTSVALFVDGSPTMTSAGFPADTTAFRSAI